MYRMEEETQREVLVGKRVHQTHTIVWCLITKDMAVVGCNFPILIIIQHFHVAGLCRRHVRVGNILIFLPDAGKLIAINYADRLSDKPRIGLIVSWISMLVTQTDIDNLITVM